MRGDGAGGVLGEAGDSASPRFAGLRSGEGKNPLQVQVEGQGKEPGQRGAKENRIIATRLRVSERTEVREGARECRKTGGK